MEHELAPKQMVPINLFGGGGSGVEVVGLSPHRWFERRTYRTNQELWPQNNKPMVAVTGTCKTWEEHPQDLRCNIITTRAGKTEKQLCDECFETVACG